jgi:hypothetical protein
MRAALSLLLVSFTASAVSAADLVVEDIFGRQLNDHGLVLVNWDGQIANPAIKFYIVPPADAAFPARAVVTAKEPRLYFDLPSEIGARGPRKVVEFKDDKKLPVLVSIFSSRDEKNEEHTLAIDFEDARGNKRSLQLPCRVIDQHRKIDKCFPVTVDFSHDRSGFFKDEDKRKVLIRAAEDWMYFFEPVALDPVPAGKEKTFIWNTDGFKTGKYVVNAEEYIGCLLYVYGIQGEELRSGGEPSNQGGLQTSKGQELSLRRSGGIEIETRGNYNEKGWLVSLKDADCWKATNLGDVENDLYSIAHHEIGHALVFNAFNPLFGKAKKKGKLEDAALKAYLGADPAIDKTDHLDGIVDPASRRGAFGYEYHGEMPLCRWQITKLDLLCAQAIGYRLRETSAFVPLQWKTAALPDGTVGRKYSAKLLAQGGIPFYHWEVISGSLPAGLSLNSFSGELSGIPIKAGTVEFEIRVRDDDEKAAGQSKKLRLEIGPE